MKVRTQYYEAHEVPPPAYIGDRLPRNAPGIDTGRSDDVLIDESGTRQAFAIGHFDHHKGVWLTDNDIVIEVTPAFRWYYLDLLKYDANPELTPPDAIFRHDLKRTLYN